MVYDPTRGRCGHCGWRDPTPLEPGHNGRMIAHFTQKHTGEESKLTYDPDDPDWGDEGVPPVTH